MRQVQLLLVCQDDDLQDCHRVWPVQLPRGRIGKPASNELKVFCVICATILSVISLLHDSTDTSAPRY
jgi:hypothetical protein